ncbi:MAG TPA: acetylserotonin O-methyltransferase [Elusimicrobia bacterium]|nr:acetylserotonin O-methyltransferase [Elusimicrobiota bacterium]HBT61628.1 acetylserotonin O-methyltransferase [Elusimicrobiota bacterium]
MIPDFAGRHQAAPIMALARGFMASRILLTAFDLDIFTALDRGPIDSVQAARRIRCDNRATDRLLNALVSLGLTRKKGRLFSNTPLAARHLVRGRPEYLAGLGHCVHLWDSWSTLTAAVRRGRSVLEPSVGRRGAAWLSAFISAMHERARAQADAVVKGLDLGAVESVLDVGGGSGAYAMAFVRAKPGLRATVFDLPQVAPLTRRYISREGLSGRVAVRAGDYEKDPLPKGFELVLLSAIIHSNSPTANIRLLRKCRRSLNPGGRIVIQDFVMNPDRTAPAFGAIFALNMLTATAAGDTYTESEIRSWLKQAGFGSIKRRDTPFASTLIVGSRSGKS